MESLFELVAASFARHGIECPPDNVQLVRPEIRPAKPSVSATATAATSALPEHNYREGSLGDPARICP
jgi:hypothetical protein